jgi:exosortase/archaeosortase family protein
MLTAVVYLEVRFGLDRFAVIGATLVALSLLVFRLTQIWVSSFTGAGWVVVVLAGTCAFIVGSKWVFEHVTFLRSLQELWPIVCLMDIFAWLIHASQIDVEVTQSSVGVAFADFTLQYSRLLLGISGIHSDVSGEVVSMGAASNVGPIAVTPLCSGLLSFILFTVAFTVVLIDVGKTLGPRRLSLLFAVGVMATFMISGLRVFLILVLGYYYGWGTLELAHQYLGYAMFLSLISLFWYLTFEWCRRIDARQARIMSINSAGLAG